MRLKGTTETERFCAKPPAGVHAALIYGADETRVADRQAKLLAAWLGPEAEAEMRLVRLAGAQLRADPAALDEALRSAGFFGGVRGVALSGLTDAQAPTLAAALREAVGPEAVVAVASGPLKKSSALRKLFEGERAAAAAPLYDDPPRPEALRRTLAEAGVPEVEPDALAALAATAAGTDHGALARLVEKLALWKLSEPGPLTLADVEACVPPAPEAAVDRALDALAEGRAGDLRDALSRLRGQGVGGVTVVLAVARRFRQLHEVAVKAERGGVEQALSGLRPPLFGPARDRLARQARRWPRRAAEQALARLAELDAQLRGGSAAPPEALLERTLMRLAMQGGR
jgi:DNA polymerase-3 subunit delta